MTFQDACSEAKIRWDTAHELASAEVASLDVDPRGIVFRGTVSKFYRQEYKGAIEENDYFLQKYSEDNPVLPERIRTLYSLDDLA